MKSDKKSKDRDDSPNSKKKIKRRYRNDRSKKWKQHSSDSNSSSDEESSRGSPSPDRHRKKTSRHQKSRKSDMSPSQSPSPEKRVKSKKKRHNSSSDSDDDEKTGRSEKRKSAANRRNPKERKRRRDSTESESESAASRSRSRSPTKSSHKKNRKRSKSPVKKKNRSPSPSSRRHRGRSRSITPKKKPSSRKDVRDEKSEHRHKKQKSSRRKDDSRSPSSPKRSVSHSPPREKRRSVKSVKKQKKERSESASPERQEERKKSESSSPPQKKKQSTSIKSPPVQRRKLNEKTVEVDDIKISGDSKRQTSPDILDDMNNSTKLPKNIDISEMDDLKSKDETETEQASKQDEIDIKAKRDEEIAKLLESAKLKRLKEKEKREKEAKEKRMLEDASVELQNRSSSVADIKENNTIAVDIDDGKLSKEKSKNETNENDGRKTKRDVISHETKSDVIPHGTKSKTNDKSTESKTKNDSKQPDTKSEKRNDIDSLVEVTRSSRHIRDSDEPKSVDKTREERKSDKRREDRHYRDNKESRHRKFDKYSSSVSRKSRSSDSSSRKKSSTDDTTTSKNSSSNSSSVKKDEPASINDLEEEMRKRKERIEAWRISRKKGDEKVVEENSNMASTDKVTLEKYDNDDATNKWSLENDEDEEEEVRQNDKTNVDVEMKTEVDEDLDSLDAFMKTIEKDLKKNTGKTLKAASRASGVADAKSSKTITVVKTVVKKKMQEVAPTLKPEVMEQNQDALEYSSEDEAPADVTATDFTDSKKKKEVVVDHDKIYYAPFRRDFYVEVPELAKMTPDELKLFRELLGDIQVRGKNVPKPLKSWAQAGLSTKVMNVLKKCNYDKPTPIQAQAIPVIMSGRDMIGIAKTGSGKTLAFLLPMFRHVLDQPVLDEEDGPIAIIMTPTRELALQIFREGKKFCRPLQLSIACIYGGSGISEQIAELKRGAEVIVCTPGRMIDMLSANNGKVTNCRRCTYLVMDEADRMFDMGFEPQVMRILDSIRRDRQTVLFSATFPRQMEAVARKVLQKPVEVQVGGRSVVCSDVEQHAVVLEADNRFLKLLELLGVYQELGSVLVFVEKQETADSLFKDLLKKGYPCLSLHGGMDQYDRDSTIADFKNGVTKLMVSTSVAARGLDVKNLILVVNYDCPNHYEDYVHRCGRTGRAGNKGTAFTFLTYEQGRNAGDIVKAFELSKCEPPDDVLSLWNIFKSEMEKEGKKVRVNSGFSGKGFKFSAEEDAQVSDHKKMQKITHGMQDSDDEAEAADSAMEKIDADLELAFSSKPKIALAPEVAEAQKTKVVDANVDKDKLKAASDRVAALNKKLSSGQVIDRNTAATAQIMSGGSLVSLTGVGLAKQLADKVNAKLNYKPVEAEVEVDAEKTKAVRYEDEVDINDFPQQARWRITSKEIIEQVREVSEAGVTVRGMYIPPNKKVTEDEKRLHLYIESLNELSIQKAKAEIKRLLKEELLKHVSHTYRGSNAGRYKVL